MLDFILNLFKRRSKVAPSRLTSHVDAFYKAGTMPRHLRED